MGSGLVLRREFREVCCFDCCLIEGSRRPIVEGCGKRDFVGKSLLVGVREMCWVSADVFSKPRRLCFFEYYYSSVWCFVPVYLDDANALLS